MRYGKTLVFVALSVCNIALAKADSKYDRACQSDDKFIVDDEGITYCEDKEADPAEKKLHQVEKKIISFLIQKDKSECNNGCGYVHKFVDAEKAWDAWVEAEFFYEYRDLGEVGAVTGRMLVTYKTEQMLKRTKKLEADFTEMTKAD